MGIEILQADDQAEADDQADEDGQPQVDQGFGLGRLVGGTALLVKLMDPCMVTCEPLNRCTTVSP